MCSLVFILQVDIFGAYASGIFDWTTNAYTRLRSVVSEAYPVIYKMLSDENLLGDIPTCYDANTPCQFIVAGLCKLLKEEFFIFTAVICSLLLVHRTGLIFLVVLLGSPLQ